MGELIKKYRLVLINKKRGNGAFKLYSYFEQNEEGMKLLRESLSDSIRMASDERFDYLDEDLEYKAYAIEEYKKTVNDDEMTFEVEYKVIK